MKRNQKTYDEYAVIAGRRAGAGFSCALALSFIFLFSCACAETITLKKPLIWSADYSSEYALPGIIGDVYAPQDFIATDGQIKTLTANWQSTGKINLEVSADNGLHYYPVVNGVPLKKGFVSGDRLRWRAQALNADAKLYTVKIDYTDTSGMLVNFGEPSLSGFNYRKEIRLKNPGSEALYNYQLKLKIGANASADKTDLNLDGRVLADFRDIRFTAADGQTPLPYYLEAVQDGVATLWIKVPQIPKAGVLVYLYYGNSEAESLSDPAATFDFYEDFVPAPNAKKAGRFSQDKWLAYLDQKGSAEIADAGIKLDAAEITTKDYKFQQGIIEYSCLVENGLENSLSLRNKNERSFENPIWMAHSSAYKGAEHCIAIEGIVKANDSAAKPASAGEQYDYRVTVGNQEMAFERFGGSPAKVTYKFDAAPKAGYLSLRSGGDGGGKGVIYFSSIRVRQYAQEEPFVDKAGAAEAVNLPVFMETKLAPSGSLALKDGAKAGYYLSTALGAGGEPARVMIADWQLEPLDKGVLIVSVSADNGLTYIKPCAAGRYYYASKNDFQAGQNFKFRFDFLRSGTSEASKGLAKFSLDYRPGKISVISPNGREDLAIGAEKKITWTAADYDPAYLFNIEYSADRGKNYALIAERVPNSGEYIWTPKPGEASRRALIRISDSLDSRIYDASDRVFNVIEPTAAQVMEEEAVKEKEKKQKSLAGQYELLIKIGDSPSAEGYKDGDVVMAKPAGYLWGAAEKGKFLIVRVPLGSHRARELTQPFRGAGVDKEGREVTRTLKKRQFRFDLENRITAQERQLADQGKLNREILELEDAGAVIRGR